MLPNLHLRAVQLSAMRIPRSSLEAAMNLKQSDSTASLQLSSQRKRDLLNHFEAIDGTLRLVHHLCAPSTRIVISYYSHLWEPVLKLAEALRLRAKQPKINYIATADFLNLMDLADFEVISQEQRQLLPRRWLGLGPLINRFIAPLPGIRRLCLRTYIVGRPVRQFPDRKFSVSIVIPCRNEKGNVENAILRMPKFGTAQEILFVEGNSGDATFEECERVRDAYRGGDRRCLDDSRRRLDHAAGGAAKISRRDRNRKSRLREWHPPDLPDGA